MDKKNVGKFLKELRTEKGWTQAEFSLQFSKFCGIDAYGGFSGAAISKWERGETLPDLYNLKDIAKFYNVTVDEILEGGRHIPVDYHEKYFGESECAQKVCADKINGSGLSATERLYAADRLFKDMEADSVKIQIQAEDAYRRLITALARNNISRTDEDELDFLCLSYFKQYYGLENGKQVIKTFDNNSLRHAKIEIKKLANSLSTRSDEELLYEINRRYCVCDYMSIRALPILGKRFAAHSSHSLINISEICELEPVHYEFIKSLSTWDKDTLLLEFLCDVSHGDDEFDYDEDDAKSFIKFLMEYGATVNHSMNYARVLKNEPRYASKTLANLYQEFYAPTVVYDEAQKRFVEVEHYTPPHVEYPTLDRIKDEYAETERKLFAGENELERKHSIIRGNSIYDISYKEYLQGRDGQLTRDLYAKIDSLTVEEIKNDYFVEKEAIQ